MYLNILAETFFCCHKLQSHEQLNILPTKKMVPQQKLYVFPTKLQCSLAKTNNFLTKKISLAMFFSN